MTVTQVASYVLFGNHLSGATILFPYGLKLEPFDLSNDNNSDAVQRVDVPLDNIDESGIQVLLKKKGQDPISL